MTSRVNYRKLCRQVVILLLGAVFVVTLTLLVMMVLIQKLMNLQ